MSEYLAVEKTATLSEALLGLRWKTIQLIYEFQKEGIVPSLKGSALRGMIGHTLKGNAPAIYDAIFAPKASDYHPFNRRYREIPPPYILSVPDRRRRVKKGTQLSVYLTLIGNAENHFPDLLTYIQDWGDRGLGKDNIPMTLCEMHMNQPKMPTIPTELFNVRIQFQTPLVIRLKDKTPIMPTFPILIHRIAERCAILSHFHANSDLVTCFDDVIERAKSSQLLDAKLTKQVWRRYSNRSEKSIPMVGWAGYILIGEADRTLLPLLWIGSCLHVGKGTTWGMGRYKITWEIV